MEESKPVFSSRGFTESCALYTSSQALVILAYLTLIAFSAILKKEEVQMGRATVRIPEEKRRESPFMSWKIELEKEQHPLIPNKFFGGVVHIRMDFIIIILNPLIFLNYFQKGRRIFSTPGGG